MPDYKCISEYKLEEMLDMPTSVLPQGLFLCWRKICGESVWTAIKNQAGEALVEDFLEKRDAVRWMHGHPVTEARKWRPDEKKMEAERIYEILR